jgi:hypothetical protein
MTVRIDDIRPLDTILGLIENLDGIWSCASSINK